MTHSTMRHPGTGEGDDAQMESVDDAFNNAPSGCNSPVVCCIFILVLDADVIQDSDARNDRSPSPVCLVFQIISFSNILCQATRPLTTHLTEVANPHRLAPRGASQGSGIADDGEEGQHPAPTNTRLVARR
jgi:hypothetical protein